MRIVLLMGNALRWQFGEVGLIKPSLQAAGPRVCWAGWLRFGFVGIIVLWRFACVRKKGSWG
jgi:hypothetical protein